MAIAGEKRQQFVSEVTSATTVVYNQLGRLRLLDRKFSSMEGHFLDQITSSIKSGNNARAKILATELSNVKRLRRTTQHSCIALEAIVIRFSTINEFATILDTIDPTVEMIRGIHEELSRAIPSASEALSEVASVTSDVLVSANLRTDFSRISTPVDEEALSILNEIEGALENEAKSKLPEVPSGMPATAIEKSQEQEENMMVET